MKWIAATLVGLFMFVGSIYSAVQEHRLSAEARNWSRGTGEILFHRIWDHRRRLGLTGYEPSVFYRFQAGAETRTGERIWLVDAREWGSRDRAQAWLNEHYPVGSRIEVIYNPSATAQEALPPGWIDSLLGSSGTVPVSEALIIDGISSFWFWTAGIGLLLFIGVPWLWWLSRE